MYICIYTWKLQLFIVICTNTFTYTFAKTFSRRTILRTPFTNTFTKIPFETALESQKGAWSNGALEFLASFDFRFRTFQPLFRCGLETLGGNRRCGWSLQKFLMVMFQSGISNAHPRFEVVTENHPHAKEAGVCPRWRKSGFAKPGELFQNSGSGMIYPVLQNRTSSQLPPSGAKGKTFEKSALKW